MHVTLSGLFVGNALPKREGGGVCEIKVALKDTKQECFTKKQKENFSRLIISGK